MEREAIIQHFPSGQPQYRLIIALPCQGGNMVYNSLPRAAALRAFAQGCYTSAFQADFVNDYTHFTLPKPYRG
jgi:hypothetical protein